MGNYPITFPPTTHMKTDSVSKLADSVQVLYVNNNNKPSCDKRYFSSPGVNPHLSHKNTDVSKVKVLLKAVQLCGSLRVWSFTYILQPVSVQVQLQYNDSRNITAISLTCQTQSQNFRGTSIINKVMHFN
jgi:hypothetical protein